MQRAVRREMILFKAVMTIRIVFIRTRDKNRAFIQEYQSLFSLFRKSARLRLLW